VHGSDGLQRVAERAVLNANWLRVRLAGVFDVPFDRPCMHEVVLSASTLRKEHSVKASTWPNASSKKGSFTDGVLSLIVDEALMIEPTETESLQTLEALADALEAIVVEARSGDQSAWAAPRTTPVSRIDEAEQPAPWSPPSTPAADPNRSRGHETETGAPLGPRVLNRRGKRGVRMGIGTTQLAEKHRDEASARPVGRPVARPGALLAVLAAPLGVVVAAVGPTPSGAASLCGKPVRSPRPNPTPRPASLQVGICWERVDHRRTGTGSSRALRSVPRRTSTTSTRKAASTAARSAHLL